MLEEKFLALPLTKKASNSEKPVRLQKTPKAYTVQWILKNTHRIFNFKHPPVDLPIDILAKENVNKRGTEETPTYRNSQDVVSEWCHSVFGEPTFLKVNEFGKYKWSGSTRWQVILGKYYFANESDLTMFRLQWATYESATRSH